MTTASRADSPTLAAKLSARSQPSADGCILWQGARNSDGYGVIRRPHGPLAYAHRVAYELHVGPLRVGLTVDHTCNVRACINPAHHEAVSLAENNRRRVARAIARRKAEAEMRRQDRHLHEIASFPPAR